MPVMAARNAPRSPQEPWETWEGIIGKLVKETFLRLNMQALCERHATEIVEKFKTRYIESGIPPSELIHLPQTVEREVKTCIEMGAHQQWDLKQDFIRKTIREALPPVMREFEATYILAISKRLFEKFVSSQPETYSPEELEKYWAHVFKDNVSLEISLLTNERGEIRDEELVRLSRAGFPQCKTWLLERYVMELPGRIRSILWQKDICPLNEDPSEFAKDVAQQVALKFMTELDSFEGKSSFGYWLGVICENEARTQRRKVIGRSKKGGRTYVSLEELQREPETPLPSEDHRKFLRDIIEMHRQQGPRAAKSANAIEWRYYDEIDNAEIARRLDTSEAYVYQLFSHDYRELKRMAEDLGISSTDL